MSYSVKDRFAIVTGSSSGIGHALVRLLLNAGCWVAVADVRLRRESEATINEFSHSPSKGKPSAIFVQTDMFDWAQISALWKTTLGRFGRIAIVVNSARVHEPPSSSFWNPPGISPLAEDPDDAHVGQYKTFAINTIGPIRLAHIALATGSNTQRFRVTFYCGHKAALLSMVKSLSGLKRALGVRNATICPGQAHTPIFEQDYCRDRLQRGDVALEPEHVAELSLKVLQEPQYGDGNIVEIMMIGSKEEQSVHVREVGLEALYPTVGPLDMGTRATAEELNFFGKVKEKGMRSSSQT
ncbi:Short-chain dehydrogenase/reductase SDR [Fusarium oxysporum f. sp. vasinfectum]|nr:Short-chain dehydrogenase/reductase SDR [Fusarium oxysporum f. sp. vasinfectum]